ncbi:50S ribosomal protein L31 [Vibrio panuliri]|uniref:Large ribosomal subunit protein bL31B n=1 Tax=Vibrio panuliri TaxID=1381081 RepID=A0A1Q9HMS1_9VIBR|nr:type B 50S ribosomal protein L31 [Vibrio panuliri]OLQ91983.1 50S ribosomal protein L31 [Vibrio panuliri]
MKEGIHPEYRKVVFHDTSVDKYFIVGSTLQTDRTIEWEDGNTYPYCTLDASSESHPFYTGKQRVLQKQGRVSNFNRRYSRFKEQK